MANNSNNYNSGASQDAPLRHVARSGDVSQPGSANARTGAASQQRAAQQHAAQHSSAQQQQNAQQRAAQQQRMAQQRATQQRATRSTSQQRSSQPLQQQHAARGAVNQQPRGAHGAAAQQQRMAQRRAAHNASQQSRPQSQQQHAVPAASAAPALSSQGRAASRRAANNSAYAAHSRGTGGAPYASRAPRQSTGVPRPSANMPAVASVSAAGAAPEAVPAAGASPTTKKRSLSSILLPVFTAIFVVCLIVLMVIFVGYWQGSKSYDDVTQQAFSGASIQEATPLDTVIDWDALRETNPDTIAWIYIPGTDINYPIVQTTNNEKYLKTDFQGETNWVVSYGALFLDYHCSADFSNQNNFVYGHNMNNGSMFAQITNLANNDTFNETRTVYLFTPTCNYKLESFALLHVDANDTLVQPSTGTSEQQSEYVQDKIDRSEVTPSEGFPEASSVERTFAFVTCDNLPTNGRYVLYCQAVETSE